MTWQEVRKEKNYSDNFFLQTYSLFQMHSMAKPCGKPEDMETQVLHLWKTTFSGEKITTDNLSGGASGE